MSSVLPFVRPEPGANKPAPVETEVVARLQLYQRMIRQWRPHFTAYEFLVLIEIADRTAGWGRGKASFSIDRLLNGDRLYAGLACQMSRRALFTAMTGLETKGVIFRETDKRGRGSISFNPNWEPDAVLNVPKRLQGQISSAPPALPECTQCTTVVHLLHPVEGNQEKVIREGNHPVSAPPRPVPDASEIVRAKMATASAASRAARTTKALTQPQKLAGLEAAWRSAVEDAFPHSAHPVWTVREKAQVKAKLKTWIGKDGPMTEFFGWAATNWSGIVAKQFRWMTRTPAPKVPEIGFFLSFMSQFLECRAEGKLTEWLASPERTEFEKLTGNGLSPEEAAAEIGKSRAVEAMREENANAQITARARVRQAKMIEQRTLAVATLPVHPDSEIARKARAAAAPPPAPFVDVDWSKVQPLDPNWEPPE